MNKQEELFPKRDEVPTNYVKSSLEELKERYKPKTEEEILDAVSLPEGQTDKLQPFESVETVGLHNVEYLSPPIEGEGKPFITTRIAMEMDRKYNNGYSPDTIDNPKAIVSIDPGSSGSITVFQPTGDIISIKMPDTPKDVFDLLKEAKNNYSVTCYMEKVQGLPGMGGSPMFNFGKGYGHLEMALLALEIQTVTIRPQEWQKTLGIGTKGKTSTTEWKNKLKAKAQQLFPSVKVTLWNADALLIGWYAQNLKK